MTAPSRGAEPAVAAKLRHEPVCDVVARPTALVFQMTAESGEGRRHILGMQLVGPGLADIGKVRLAGVPQQTAEFWRPGPGALGIEGVLTVKHRLPKAHTTRGVQKVRPLPNRVQLLP